MARLTPYLIVRDAARAIEFYKAAFGATEAFRLTSPDGRIGHAHLTMGADAEFMLADEWPDFGALAPGTVGGTPVSLHLSVEDADVVVARAAGAGATVLRAVEDKFYGERSGMIADPFGHRWQVAAFKEVVSPEEMQKRWDAGIGA